MSLAHIGTIARLELIQRLRSAGWYVLLGVFAVVLLGVTILSFLVFSGNDDYIGGGVFSVVVNMVLLLVVLVSPTLSGNAINGDREAATLAPVQITAASTGDIMLGKLLAAVATGGAFLLVAVPFLVVGLIAGGVRADTLFVSLLVLAAEIVIVAAIGVGLSGLLARPLFSVAATYLVVAALTIGTLIAFGLGGAAMRSEVTSYNRPYDSNGEPVCDEWDVYSYDTPRFDRVWGFLAANPFVVLADATPTTFDRHGYATDLFGQIKFAVRAAQQAPELETRWDDCERSWETEEYPTQQEVIESSVPSWFVGLGLQTLIAGGLFAGAWARTATPARRLPPGTRIACAGASARPERTAKRERTNCSRTRWGRAVRAFSLAGGADAQKIICTAFSSVYASMPARPISRPMPLPPRPPQGVAMSGMPYALTHTLPTRRSRAALCARCRFSVNTIALRPNCVSLAIAIASAESENGMTVATGPKISSRAMR